jgi:hypothetical protein
MGQTFSADVARIRQWQNIMREITNITDNAVGDYEAEARACMDWVGQDDAMAENLRPRDKEEREGVSTTGTSLTLAISGVARALQVNGNYIQGAQNDANEAISDAARKSGKH